VVQRWGPQFVKEGETIRFFVTLEPRFQRLAERHLADLVSEGAVPSEYEAGAVMMTGDGRVRAMIGAVDWSQRQFNAAVKSNVQPGSTAKLPLLVAACEAGRKPESRVVDLPITATWPSNGALGYKGETTLKEAFAYSRNAAAVRLTQELGVRKVAEVSRRLGIEPGPEPDAGFVLGTFSTNVMSVTAAYTAVANGGHRVTPTGILAVVDGRGEVRANFVEQTRIRVISERCVEPTRAVLNEVVRSGTGQGAALGRWKAYGKTGTTTGHADAWFIGWSEGRVLGVWMGKRRDASGEGLAGKGAPAEFFRRVSNSANEMMDYRAAQELLKGSRRTAPVMAERPKQPDRARGPERKSTEAHLLDPTARPSMPRVNSGPYSPSPRMWDDEPWPDEEDTFSERW
jgi:penicillin-binding protein 1A